MAFNALSATGNQTLAHVLPNRAWSRVDINMQSFASCSQHIFVSGDSSHTFVDILFSFGGKHPILYYVKSDLKYKSNVKINVRAVWANNYFQKNRDMVTGSRTLHIM